VRAADDAAGYEMLPVLSGGFAALLCGKALPFRDLLFFSGYA